MQHMSGFNLWTWSILWNHADFVNQKLCCCVFCRNGFTIVNVEYSERNVPVRLCRLTWAHSTGLLPPFCKQGTRLNPEHSWIDFTYHRAYFRKKKTSKSVLHRALKVSQFCNSPELYQTDQGVIKRMACGFLRPSKTEFYPKCPQEKAQKWYLKLSQLFFFWISLQGKSPLEVRGQILSLNSVDPWLCGEEKGGRVINLHVKPLKWQMAYNWGVNLPNVDLNYCGMNASLLLVSE